MEPQGGQPQWVPISQGETRPGVVHGLLLRRRSWEELPVQWRLPYALPMNSLPPLRVTPRRRPDARLSNPVPR